MTTTGLVLLRVDTIEVSCRSASHLANGTNSSQKHRNTHSAKDHKGFQVLSMSYW